MSEWYPKFCSFAPFISHSWPYWRGTKFISGFEITFLCDFSQHNLSQIKQLDLGSIWCYFDLKVNLPASGNSFSLFSFTTLSSLYWSLSSNVWPLFQYFLQISQAVTTTQPSLTQTTVMETVTMVTTREQILVKHAQEELPPPPPQKKRQIIVDSEIRKRWEAFTPVFIFKISIIVKQENTFTAALMAVFLLKQYFQKPRVPIMSGQLVRKIMK